MVSVVRLADLVICNRPRAVADRRISDGAICCRCARATALTLIRAAFCKQRRHGRQTASPFRRRHNTPAALVAMQALLLLMMMMLLLLLLLLLSLLLLRMLPDAGKRQRGYNARALR